MTLAEKKAARLAKLSQPAAITDKIQIQVNKVLELIDNADQLKNTSVVIPNATQSDLDRLVVFLPENFGDVVEVIKKGITITGNQLNDTNSIEAKFTFSFSNVGANNNRIVVKVQSHDNYLPVGSNQVDPNSYNLTLVDYRQNSASIADINASNTRFRGQFNNNIYDWKCAINGTDLVITAPDDSGEWYNKNENFPVITVTGSVAFNAVTQSVVGVNPDYSKLIWNPSNTDKTALKNALEAELGGSIKMYEKKMLILI